MCRDSEQDTPLHNAAFNGHLDIVQFFVCDENCDASILGQYGLTPLHFAALGGHLHNIVNYLIDDQGCNPSSVDDLNRTPLHLATKEGHMDIVKFLTVEKHAL